ncbi:MAG TPA: glycine cleavage system aminomethyltransferase GcvT [Pseudobdellovibrionaceae bacterium]|nr:glycine cleavage system aminomethyltransferase GcvT [Pseudobdellovibrionaceae bacterium]
MSETSDLKSTSAADTPKRTPLAGEHEALGARMVDFAGWWMPVQYVGLKEEHLACRSGVGLFDVSHMGEFRVTGPEALASLQWLTTNDVSKLAAGQAQYSLLPNASGGLVDDLYVYCIKPGEEYLLCVNAANVDKDFAHIMKNARGGRWVNESADWGQIAVQGPKAPVLLERLFPGFASMPKNTHREFDFAGGRVRVATTGYTGEDGAEVFVPAGQTVALWRELMRAGQDLGVAPIGLGARDTLRTEMKYSLYGHEIDDSTNPFEAGLGWVVKPAAKDFLGRAPMLAVKEAGLKRKLIGLELLERGIPRQGYKVLSSEGREIGVCTSGTMSPSTGASIAIAFVATEFAADGTEIAVDIRGKAVRAKVRPTPFVVPGSKLGAT